MNTLLKIFITFILTGLSIYFYLIWNGSVPRPNGFPTDIDPLSALVGIAMAVMLWMDEIKSGLHRRNR